MDPTRHLRQSAVCLVGLSTVLMMTSETLAQMAGKPVIGVAEVTGEDVYVRSGPSLNHYTITKLKLGDRVTVVGENGDWYEIHPPQGTHSLISGDYIDTADNNSGVVNGNNVRVRAGSLLNKNKYTVQLMLSKGAEVEIVGRNPDGFLRIKPPPGTTAWINRNFVEYVPGDAARRTSREGDAPVGEGDDGEQTEQESAAVDQAEAKTDVEAVEESDPSKLGGLPLNEQRKQLLEFDAGVTEELTKSVSDRNLQPWIEKYRILVEQDEDAFSQSYAQVRLDQLTRMAALNESVRKVRTLGEQAQQKRREFLEGRARIRTVVPQTPTGLDVQGVLRASALYPPNVLPRRYRLVESGASGERTIGYVEIPQGSPINVAEFLGRYVGVRASAKRLQAGGVDAIPIFVARELVALEPVASPTETIE